MLGNMADVAKKWNGWLCIRATQQLENRQCKHWTEYYWTNALFSNYFKAITLTIWMLEHRGESRVSILLSKGFSKHKFQNAFHFYFFYWNPSIKKKNKTSSIFSGKNTAIKSSLIHCGNKNSHWIIFHVVNFSEHYPLSTRSIIEKSSSFHPLNCQK